MPEITVIVTVNVVPDPGETVEDVAEETVEMMSADAATYGIVQSAAWVYGNGDD